MPIPSHNFGAVLFLEELLLQCQLVTRSAERLDQAAAYWIDLERSIHERTIAKGDIAAPIAIIADCVVCLSAMAAIRRILYPSGSVSNRVQKRSAVLLNMLGNPSLPNLIAISVRNSWEHFDERLDEFLTKKISKVYAPYVAAAPPKSDSIVLRRFDPVGFAIYFGNDPIALRPCIEEVKFLFGRIHQAFKCLETDRIEI